MNRTKNSILKLVQEKGILRSKDLDTQYLSRVSIARLVAEGQLSQLSRGIYALPNRVISEKTVLAELAIKYPNSIFCLLTALQIHELTTQTPHQVWLAIDVKARKPNIQYPPLRVVHFSGQALSTGIVTITVDGATHIRVTSIEKTIVDCFKFRNKVGIDVAIEALHDAWSSKRLSMDKLWTYAKICRVNNVIRPYIESLNG